MSERPVAVVALGGNALIRQGETGNVDQQKKHIRDALTHLDFLLQEGYSLLITHGNGPIVGHLLLQNEAAKEIVPAMPLDVCDADSEGSIGYLTQQTLANLLRGTQQQRNVVSLITQIRVDPADKAFLNPTKPVGPFYSFEQAALLRKAKGWVLLEDAGRGYRRMVPSPQPLEVIEEETIRLLLDHGVIVIAAGGGGIPVARDETGRLYGVEAVIDKDRASALLASRLQARLLIILTAIDGVYRNFNSPKAEMLRSLDKHTAKTLLEAGEFAAGSMRPKIEAALDFLDHGGEKVIITLPELLPQAMRGETGTVLVS